ncbi:MAG: hypothetical protein L6R39_000958 [Caloplaca ligustica]|nr:MAG: hypothetical protein L6R39_000958 [Caloplaca ligustica]
MSSSQKNGLSIRGAAGGRGGRGGFNDRGGFNGRGAFSDRGRGKPGRGHGRPKFNVDMVQAQIDQQHYHHQNELATIVVKGVLDSDVANENDSGFATCRNWLEDWGRQGLKRPAEYVYLKSPRWDDHDNFVFGVKKNEVWRFEKANGENFHGAILSVQRADHQGRDSQKSTHNPTPARMSTADKAETFKRVLAKRYNAQSKVLDLDYLGIDPQLEGTGTWDPSATRPKYTDFFPAMMRLCEGNDIFPSRAEKAEQVQSITLRNNDLTNVGPIFEVARAFPDIRNLDLSSNKIKDSRALDPFRYKFKRLDWLILSPNPIESEDLEYEHTISSWYPTLRTLNETRVRSDEAAASAASNAASSASLPLATIKDNFQDEAGIAESAIKGLLHGMDIDRPTLARSLYDNESTFSLSYNPSAPRLDNAQSTSWEPHLNQSRNLKKVFQLEPRIRRMAKGINEIEQALKILPPTRHPDFINDSLRYSFDCTPIPGVPDPNGRIESGVGGFKVDVHGSFEEYDRLTGQKNATRSFDRVFILGPGAGENQLRIVSDILVLRAEGGYEAFHPETKTMPELPIVTKNFGFPTDAKAEAEVKQAFVAGEVSKATGLKAEFATQLLNDSAGNYQTAVENFGVARRKGLLRNGYFMPEVHAASLTNPLGTFY